jgi:hypothetical protein
MDMISKLHEVDPVFREVVDLLFGDAVDPREAYDVSKMDASEVHVNGGLKVARCKTCKCSKDKCKCVDKRERTKAEREKLQAKVGLASNVVGLAAGATALGAAARDERLLGGGKVARKMHAAADKLPKISPRTGRAGAAVALGALGLQTANTGGDLVANRVLARESKKDVKKALDDIVEARRQGQISTATAIELAENLIEKSEPKHRMSRAKLTARAEMAEDALKTAPKAAKAALVTTAAVGAGTGYAVGRRAGKKAAQRKLAPIRLPETGPAPKGKHRVGGVEKAEQVDYVYTGEISKMDEDKRLVFGWCNLSTVDGKPVVDLQGDYAPIDEIEKSAYAYVVKSRVGGNQHERQGERALHVSDMVESFVATPEKLEQLGVPADIAKGMPTGWWVGYHVNDDATWNQVKTGERAGFSIHGKGSRVQKALEGAAS